MRHKFLLFAIVSMALQCVTSRAQDAAAPDSVAGERQVGSASKLLPSSPITQGSTSELQPAELNGTVTDTNGDPISGATVALDGSSAADHQTQEVNDSGFFQFRNLKSDMPYHVTVSAKGFQDWTSPAIVLASGQFFDVTDIKLKLVSSVSSVTVYSSTEQIATQQVRLEEQQRVLGFIPNFYVVYDSKDAVPMTTKLKFQMALRVSVDPITFLGTGFLAGINQAADTPDFQQGAKGYGQRFSVVYADGLTDTLFGGAILPTLLHQDPRYFYQGTGSTKSRLMHALSSPLICRGDNGQLQPNFSSIGGDLISSSFSNLYYPSSNRGPAFVFENLAISTAERAASSVFQEFVVRRFTPNARGRN